MRRQEFLENSIASAEQSINAEQNVIDKSEKEIKSLQQKITIAKNTIEELRDLKTYLLEQLKTVDTQIKRRKRKDE
jgi:peptidoglycan hydrolase CwlO-like protein